VTRAQAKQDKLRREFANFIRIAMVDLRPKVAASGRELTDDVLANELAHRLSEAYDLRERKF